MVFLGNITQNAPAFDEVWPLIEPFIRDQNVVAHNSAFDVSCIRQTLDKYGIATPNFNEFCTYKIYRKSLSFLCQSYGIKLEHHNALSDAMPCARLYLKYLNSQS